jgi:hypothetical protein
MSVPFSPYNIKFKSTQTIYQQEITCQVNENEFNLTLNPSATSDRSGSLRDFATGSDFQPYVTTVGLYNESNELLVVGKLAQPFRLPSNTDVTFVIRYDF